MITYSLFLIPFNYLYYDLIPFTYSWKMMKDTTNHILENVLGYSETSRKILKYYKSYVPGSSNYSSHHTT